MATPFKSATRAQIETRFARERDVLLRTLGAPRSECAPATCFTCTGPISCTRIPSIEAAFVRKTNDETLFNTVASMPEYGLTVLIAAQHLLFIADVFNDQFGLGAGATLQALMDEAKSLPAEQ